LALIAVSSCAQAQEASERLIRSDTGLRRDARLEARDLGELPAFAALRAVDWKLTLGIARTAAESGDRITSTPFQLRARFNEGRTAVKLTGTGYSSIRSDQEGSLSGFNDVFLMLTQCLSNELVAEGGVGVPAGGEVGSLHNRERLGAIYNHPFTPRWEGQLHGRVTYYNGDLKPGVSHARSQGLAQVTYNLDTPRSDVVVQIVRSYRAGSTSASSVAVVYEFPVAQQRRPPMAAVSFTRGVTSDTHDNTIELDLSLRF
jgi:hypothetical protein